MLTHQTATQMCKYEAATERSEYRDDKLPITGQHTNMQVFRQQLHIKRRAINTQAGSLKSAAIKLPHMCDCTKYCGWIWKQFWLVKTDNRGDLDQLSCAKKGRSLKNSHARIDMHVADWRNKTGLNKCMQEAAWELKPSTRKLALQQSQMIPTDSYSKESIGIILVQCSNCHANRN